VLDATPYPQFDAAARATLDHLGSRLDLPLWTIARRQSDGWRVLYQAGRLAVAAPGARLAWSDLCTALVEGAGPPVAPVVAEVAAYAEALAPRNDWGGHGAGGHGSGGHGYGGHAPARHAVLAGSVTTRHSPTEFVPEAVGTELATEPVQPLPARVGAFMGVPIQVEDGALFGVLAGIDPNPQPPELAAELPLVRLLARMLGTILAAELRAEDAARAAERAEADTGRDPLTGLVNRQGWDWLLRHEDERARRYGSPAAVVSVDLEGGGRSADDDTVLAAARTIVAVTRAHDVVARLGGAELGVLAVECDAGALAALVARLKDELATAGLTAAVGAAVRPPDGTLEQAWLRADAAVTAASRGAGAA
jgi:diguanylate cyclase (GGDEF)-like protein